MPSPNKRMLRNLPDEQWPPLPPHLDGSEFALDAMYGITRKVLIETQRDYKSLIHKTKPGDLILQIKDSNVPAQPLGILHGLENPSSANKKPLLVRPAELTIETLNNIALTDRIQIARVMCFEYAASCWEAAALQEALEDAEMTENTDMGEPEDEQWLSPYDWETDQGQQEEDEEGYIDLYRNADFTAHMKQMSDLQNFYKTLIAGTLSSKDLYLSS